MKVCHVLSSLGVGGIERWLLRHIAEQFQINGEDEFHVLCLMSGDHPLKKEFEELGCMVIEIGFSKERRLRSINKIRAVFVEQEYDVVHSHLDYLSGLVLPLAMLSGVLVRINHIHTTNFDVWHRGGMIRASVAWALKLAAIKSSSTTVGCSRAALTSFLGNQRDSKRSCVHYCGIPWNEFSNSGKKRDLQKYNRFKILHVGRHEKVKNIEFILQIAKVLYEEKFRFKVLLVGDGSLHFSLMQRAQQLGISDRIEFLGARDDVARIMAESSLLLLPSLFEGLPVTVVEAQAAGLMSVISDTITTEVVLVDELVQQVPLSIGADGWAEKIKTCMTEMSDRKLHNTLDANPFDISNDAKLMRSIYRANNRRRKKLA